MMSATTEAIPVNTLMTRLLTEGHNLVGDKNFHLQ